MDSLETERLILRKYEKDDFDAVHSYASCLENVIYMNWGPNSARDTRTFIRSSIKKANKKPCTHYIYAVVLKDSRQLIGGCELSIQGTCGHLGWIFHRAYWGRGYGTEAAKALLDFGFGKLNLRRILSDCYADNHGSYRIMEKIGMRREGLFLECAPPPKLTDREYGDEVRYALLKKEWEVQHKH